MISAFTTAYVRANVVLRNPEMIDISREIYTDFFKQICDVTGCSNPNSPESDLTKYIYDKWRFFTTNYDNIIEDFWVTERNYDSLNLGFVRPNGEEDNGC